MGTKNNPQNRGKTSTKKKFNGKDIEPVLVIGEKNYIGAKYSKTTDIICDNNGNPIPWKEVVNK